TPFTPDNAKTNPYAFNVNTAASLLKSHGWTVNPGGTSVCTSAGTGSNQCGDGIPAGTKLAFNMIYNTSPALIGQPVNAPVSPPKQARLNLPLNSHNFH